MLYVLSFLFFTTSPSDSVATVKHYYDQANSFLSTDLDSTIFFVEKIIDYSKVQSNPEWEFKARLIQSMAYSRKDDFVKQDSILNILDHQTPLVSDELKVFHLFGSASFHYHQREYSIAYDKYYEGYNLLDTTWKDYSRLKLGALINLALMSYNMIDYNKAIDYNLEALDLNPNSYRVLNQLGNLFKEIRDFPSAKHYYKLCFSNENIYVKSRYSCLYGYQATLFLEEKQDSSTSILDQIIASEDSCQSNTYILSLDAKISRLADKGLFDEAYELFEELERRIEGRQNRKLKTKELKAYLLMKSGDLDEAYQLYYDLFKSDLFVNGDRQEKRGILKGLITSKVVNKEFGEAWKSYQDIQDSIRSDDLIRVTAIKERKYNLAKEKEKQKLLQLQNEAKQATISAQRNLLGIGLLGLVLVGSIATSYRQRKKSAERQVKTEEELRLTKEREAEMLLEENMRLEASNEGLTYRVKALETDTRAILNESWTINPKGRKQLQVKIGDILAISTSPEKANTLEYLLKDSNTKPLERRTMKNMENDPNLIKEIFMRVHQSHIVNLHNIASIDSTKRIIHLKNSDSIIQVSDAYLDALLKRYVELRKTTAT